MQVLEITGYRTGVDDSGVNYLDPVDAFQNIEDGYIYRQVLQSRRGFSRFSLGKATAGTGMGETPDGTRVMGIFEFIKTDNTTQLLVASKEYLYRYNPLSNLFEQIPNTSTIPATFGIINNEDYVSGTSYPFTDGSSRFVFTGRGMTAIWQYDGTSISRFNLVADNPNYQEPLNPLTSPRVPGILTNALHIISFGLRLNLFCPVISGNEYNHHVLFSASVDADGDGDKFASPGAGILGANTNDYIQCAVLLGNIFTCNFNRSSWALETTSDVFNPYFWRKIPSVLGSDAAFSGVSWFDQELAGGKTGMITTDGRQQLRFDNKLPYFTKNEVNQTTFDLMYGGWNRDTAQFMFSYQMEDSELDNTQDQVLIYNYEEESFSYYNQRFSCFGQCDVGVSLNWDDIDETNNPSWLEWDTTEELWDEIGQTEGVQKTLAGDNNGYVYQLEQDFDDYFSSITGIATGATTTLTIDPEGLAVGDQISIIDVEGMVELNDDFRDRFDWPIILSLTGTSITINVNSTDFTAWVPNTGSVSKVINFTAQTNPFNPYRNTGYRIYVSHVEFLLDNNGGFLQVSTVTDEQLPIVSAPVLIEPDITLNKPRQWITMVVNQEYDFISFILNQQSVSAQVRLTSMRIHYAQGGSDS